MVILNFLHIKFYVKMSIYLYIKMQYQSRKKNLMIKWEKSNRVQHSTSYLQINALIWYRNDYNDNSGTGISPSLFHTHSHTNSPNDKRKHHSAFPSFLNMLGADCFLFFLSFLIFCLFWHFTNKWTLQSDQTPP